jgi:predicted dehydrogenase
MSMNKETSSVGRRDFLRAASSAGVGLWLSGGVPSSYARGSYVRSRSPNETVRVAVMGVNGRGGVLARSFARAANSEVACICDVDQAVLARVVANVSEQQGRTPDGVVDFRRVLEDPQVDALVIAAPDHWHAPATILALQAGKHVYVEKPASHNPREGELMIEAQRKHNRVVQMGNQQRSDPRSIEIVQRIHDGLIGRAYYARTWYANTRGPIGRGTATAPPSGLDYELWQGPAPRRPYQDNLIHYNWHWFWNWGTGEINNNGTHEIDVARWALQVEFPTRVTSVGGRYHFEDDWEFPDTQDAGFDFEGGKTIVWQGRSCNGFPILNRGRGLSVHGTDGTVVLDRSGYEVYDLENTLVERSTAAEQVDALDTRGGDNMTDRHINNFLAAIRTGEALRSPIDEGQKSVLLCHLGNIAQMNGGALQTDPRTGRIQGDRRAQRMWAREYARGWRVVV